MTTKHIQLLDTVALLENIPERSLRRGEVGTVVEVLAPDVYEVEFCDDEGQTYMELALRSNQLIALHTQGEALKMGGLTSIGVGWRFAQPTSGLVRFTLGCNGFVALSSCRTPAGVRTAAGVPAARISHRANSATLTPSLDSPVPTQRWRSARLGSPQSHTCRPRR